MRRRARGEFDTFLCADYSGADSTSAQRQAIALWRLDRGGRPRRVPGPFTRDTLREVRAAARVEGWILGAGPRPRLTRCVSAERSPPTRLS